MKTSSEFTIQFGCLVKYRGRAVKVEIPAGVTSIGRRAFYQSGITEVILPDTVTEIEAEAFGFTPLKKAVFKGKITKVGAGAFPRDPELDEWVFQQVPIVGFSKADREFAIRFFIEHDKSFNSDVRNQNIAFMGKNITKQVLSGLLCDALIENEDLFYEVIQKRAIHANSLDALIEHFYELNTTQLVAALLDYKNGIRKTGVGADKPQLELTDSEITIADWRKLYRFKYTGGFVEITGCLIQDDDIEVPTVIGKKTVGIIGHHAFDGHTLPDRESFGIQLPKKRIIVIPNGVREIKAGAFYCINNREIWLPESVEELHDGIFVAVSQIILYVPESIAFISNDLVWDSSDGSVSIHKVKKEMYGKIGMGPLR